jgi:DNA repair photolyase
MKGGSGPEAGEHRDALTQGRVRGRGAGLAPGNRFERVRLHVLGEHLDERAREHPEGVQTPTRVVPERTDRIINRVDSPDLGFHWTINPYRGCEHGCIYCYARPTHELLGMSCGLDFETTIVAKREAPALVRRELGAAGWAGEPIVLSGVTDAYQPREAEERITRGVLEVMAECRQPVSIVTKSRLVLRDLDLLRDLARHDAVRVAVSLTSLENRLASTMEPRAASPGARLGTMRALSEAGVPVTVMTAPIIPGLNDHEIPGLLRAAGEAGATRAGLVLIRLPFQIKDLFVEWLTRHFPDRAAKVASLIRESRGGALNDPNFGTRFTGEGPRAEQIRQTFETFARRFGLSTEMDPPSGASFRRPMVDHAGQMRLFG